MDAGQAISLTKVPYEDSDDPYSFICEVCGYGDKCHRLGCPNDGSEPEEGD